MTTIAKTAYRLVEARLGKDDVEAILKGAAGLDQRQSTVDWSEDCSFPMCVILEKSSAHYPPADPTDELARLATTLAQLDTWDASSTPGNGLAQRAARLIRALTSKSAPAVKPLEWEDVNEEEWEANCLIGSYNLYLIGSTYKAILSYAEGSHLYHKQLGEGLELEEAQKVCQSDYEPRVLEVIV